MIISTKTNCINLFKINDMRLLENAYMKKGDLLCGEEAAVKVAITILVTQ